MKMYIKPEIEMETLVISEAVTESAGGVIDPGWGGDWEIDPNSNGSSLIAYDDGIFYDEADGYIVY